MNFYNSFNITNVSIYDYDNGLIASYEVMNKNTTTKMSQYLSREIQFWCCTILFWARPTYIITCLHDDTPTGNRSRFSTASFGGAL